MAITKKQRIGIVISAIWVGIALVYSLAGYYRAKDMIISVLILSSPVAIAWGIWWIRRAKS